MHLHRAIPPGVLVVTTASVGITAVLYGRALQLLASGPDIAGYDLLTVADRASIVSAVLLAASGVLLAAARGAQWVVVALLVACVGTFGVSRGLETLGSTLANLQPTEQPIDLNSLLLAMTGTGAALVPLPWILGTGAIVALVTVRARRRRVIAVAPANQ